MKHLANQQTSTNRNQSKICAHRNDFWSVTGTERGDKALDDSTQ